MIKHGLFLLSLSSVHVQYCFSEDCDVFFKTDVFTHSKSKERPLRIKMRQNVPSSPCNLTIILPDQQTVKFNVNNSNIAILTVPVQHKHRITLKRKGSDKLWLQVNSSEVEETRAGEYNIAGKQIFTFQTPSEEDIISSQVENMRCEGNMDLIKKFGIPRGSSEIEAIEIQGSIRLNQTKMFQLCRKYNDFSNDSQPIEYNTNSVTVGEEYLNFTITVNETLKEFEVGCYVKGGDGVKEYKIKFRPNLSECEHETGKDTSININTIIIIVVTTTLAIIVIVIVGHIYRKKKRIHHPLPAEEISLHVDAEGQLENTESQQ